MQAIQIFLNMNAIRLLFKAPETADAVWQSLTNPALNSLTLGGNDAFTPLHLRDDFGTEIQLNQKPSALLREDMLQSAEGQIETALHGEHTKIKYGNRMAADPKLNGQLQRGPAILSPMHASNGRGY